MLHKQIMMPHENEHGHLNLQVTHRKVAQVVESILQNQKGPGLSPHSTILLIE